MSQQWQLFLLGELRVQRGEQVITRFKYQKVGGLLAYLAYHPRQMHAREVLIDLFWPESHPDAARNNLSTALSSLRNQLEPPGTPTGTVLRADRYSVGINSAMMTTDVADFEQAVREAGRTASATERVQNLEHAVSLYQGRLLPGYYEDWIIPEQERLAGVFFDTVSLLIQHLEEQHDLPTALRYGRQAVSVEPLREEAHQHLMRLLAATGQPGAALRQFKELERLLEEEMGEEPSAPLRALYRQIEKQSGLITPVLLSAATTTYAPVTTALAPSSLPTYPTTFTFLMTDVAGIAPPSEPARDAYQSAQERHHRTLTSVFARFGGQVWKQSENGFLVAFSGAKQALSCAVAAQQAMAEQAGPEATGSLTIRMALHTGDVEKKEGDWQGEALHRASRILTAGHGGQLLLSEVTAGLVRRDLPEEVTLSDRGVYRLRDVPTPERLYEAHYPGRTQTEFPPLSAEAGYPASLPVQVTRFFGREQEIAQITHQLRDEGTRLLTLTGTGGTGKTRLAIQAAERLVEAFGSAVWFVPLADLSDASLIPSAILDSLHLPRSPLQEPLEQVVEALNQQPSLLVLDNFEHLADSGAEIVQALLTRVFSLVLIITSRQVLGLSGEQAFAVAPLPTPNGGEGLEQLSLFDSVRLFVDRAQAVKPEFQVTSYNAPAIAELCQRLEGIPLAIELAAARVEVLPPYQMLAQLADRFKLLTTRRRDVSERHRTLEAAVDWSFQLLSPELQRFFSRLSLFRGGWTTEAAEAVSEEPLTLDYLAQLRDHSLVLSEETESGVRFRMLETVREYGQQELSLQERVFLSQRHINYFVQLAEASPNDYYGGPRGEHYDVLAANMDNIRTALAWSRQPEGDAVLGLRLALAMKSFSDIRGYWKEMREALEQGLALAPDAPIALCCQALRGLAYILRRVGEKQQANQVAEQGLTLARESSDYRAAGEILVEMGRIDEALASFRKTNQDWAEAWCLDNKHTIGIERGEYASARVWFEERLEVSRKDGHLGRQRSHLFRLGQIALRQGEYDRARAYLEECLSLSLAIRNKAFVGYCHRNIGDAELAEGDYATARARFEESLTIMREVGDTLHAALSLTALGEAALDQGDTETVQRLSKESLALCENKGMGKELGMALSLDNLGALALRQQDHVLARACFLRSLKLKHQDVGDVWHVAGGLDNIAKVLAVDDDQGKAVRILSAATALRDSIGAPRRPIDRADHEALLTALRDALGPEGFISAWVAGQAMTWDEAVAYALAEVHLV